MLNIVEGEELDALTEKQLTYQLVLRWDAHFRKRQIANNTAAAVIADKIAALEEIATSNPILAIEIADLIETLELIA